MSTNEALIAELRATGLRGGEVYDLTNRAAHAIEALEAELADAHAAVKDLTLRVLTVATRVERAEQDLAKWRKLCESARDESMEWEMAFSRAEQERDAAQRELRDRELHHFEAEAAIEEALGEIQNIVAVIDSWSWIPERDEARGALDSLARILTAALGPEASSRLAERDRRVREEALGEIEWEYGADYFGEMLVYETFEDASADLDNRPTQEDRNVYRRRHVDWERVACDHGGCLAASEFSTPGGFHWCFDHLPRIEEE